MGSHSIKSKNLRAGDALMLEHDDIRAELARTAMESGSIGEAAKRLAHLCVSHFEQEEKQVFPVLDLLNDLASGVVQPEMASVLPLVSLFRARHRDLDDHHESILMAVDALDGTFSHSVMKGLGEVATLGNMTAEAEIVGRLLQQTGQAGTLVNALAVGAGKPAL